MYDENITQRPVDASGERRGMLKSHFQAIENHLLSLSQIPANTGHPLHKGTPREAFLHAFLENHLSERVAIGSGEVIDANSRPNERRRQIDIVIYKREFPKLDFGGGVHGFLNESVIATIEVKSILDRKALKQSVVAARSLKNLSRNVVTFMTGGYQPPSILNYVVSYDGPKKMSTIYKWLYEINKEEDNSNLIMPDNLVERSKIVSPSLDGIFVLGKGFLHFDNFPVSFMDDDMRKRHSEYKWIFADSETGNLFLIFLFLTIAVGGANTSWLDPLPYLSGFQVDGVHFGK